MNVYMIKERGLQECLDLCAEGDVIIDKAEDLAIVIQSDDEFVVLSDLKLDGTLNKRLCSRDYVKSQVDGWWHYYKGLLNKEVV